MIKVDNKNRFEVSTEGMKLLHEGRPLWELVKELIANAWDEDITRCEVSLIKATRSLVEIMVEDDGAGFRDITDAYTLFAPTPKQQTPSVRGRFNLGEKELLSVAYSGYIDTVGSSVGFPASGGRKTVKNFRTKGTCVRIYVKASKDSLAHAVDKLQTFIPPKGIRYAVNDQWVKNREPVAITNAMLPTVLSSAPNQPIRKTRRKTDISVYEPLVEGQGQIYEMGIPIQKIAVPFDIDIGQKVPLPPNRDIVPTAYLQDVYSEVLAAIAIKGYITEENASDTWVRLAVEDSRTPDEIVKIVMDKKLGERALIATVDSGENERAINKGYSIVNGKTLSPIERKRFYEVGLGTAHKFAIVPDFSPDAKPLRKAKMTLSLESVAEYTQWLSTQMIGYACEVVFVSDLRLNADATWDNSRRTFTWNVMRLGKRFFENAPTQEQTALILHEVSHIAGDDPPHGEKFVSTLGDIAAKAVFLALTLGDDLWWAKAE